MMLLIPKPVAIITATHVAAWRLFLLHSITSEFGGAGGAKTVSAFPGLAS